MAAWVAAGSPPSRSGVNDSRDPASWQAVRIDSSWRGERLAALPNLDILSIGSEKRDSSSVYRDIAPEHPGCCWAGVAGIDPAPAHIAFLEVPAGVSNCPEDTADLGNTVAREVASCKGERRAGAEDKARPESAANGSVSLGRRFRTARSKVGAAWECSADQLQVTSIWTRWNQLEMV